MNLPRWRSPFAFLLLLVLVVPILAACGGTAATPAQTTAGPATEATPATDAGGAEATTATDAGEAATTATEGEATAETDTDAEATADTGAEAEATAEEGADTGAAGADPNAVSPAGNIFRISYNAEPDTLDPQKASFMGEIDKLNKNYTALMRFDPQKLTPIPGAAESVEVSEDGQTLTFKLKPDQKYSDGAPLTAENFEYAWKRLCDPALASDYQFIGSPITGCDEFFNAFSTGNLTVTDQAQLTQLRDQVGVSAVDEGTLQIKLKESAPYFVNVAALWVGYPTRQDLVEKGGETWWQSPETFIGNGPFKLDSWEPNSRITWSKNENWVLAEETPVKIDGIEETYAAEAQAAFESYRSGELDVFYVPGEFIETVNNDGTLKAQLKDQGGQCTFYLGFNNAIPPFDKMEVRQAFAQALDREAWVRDVLKGVGAPAYSFIRPGIPGHDPNSQQWKYDPAAAKQKLTAAGFDFNQELKLTYSQSALNKLRYEYLASRLQQDLGIKISLNPIDRTEYTALLKDKETTPPMFILGWCTDFPDPQNWITAVWKSNGSGSSRVGWKSDKLDELVNRADTMKIDNPERAQLYQQAQEIIINEAPAAMFWYEQVPFLQQPWVQLRPTLMDAQTPGLLDVSSIQIKTE